MATSFYVLREADRKTDALPHIYKEATIAIERLRVELAALRQTPDAKATMQRRLDRAVRRSEHHAESMWVRMSSQDQACSAHDHHSFVDGANHGNGCSNNNSDSDDDDADVPHASPSKGGRHSLPALGAAQSTRPSSPGLFFVPLPTAPLCTLGLDHMLSHSSHRSVHADDGNKTAPLTELNCNTTAPEYVIVVSDDDDNDNCGDSTDKSNNNKAHANVSKSSHCHRHEKSSTAAINEVDKMNTTKASSSLQVKRYITRSMPTKERRAITHSDNTWPTFPRASVSNVAPMTRVSKSVSPMALPHATNHTPPVQPRHPALMCASDVQREQAIYDYLRRMNIIDMDPVCETDSTAGDARNVHQQLFGDALYNGSALCQLVSLMCTDEQCRNDHRSTCCSGAAVKVATPTLLHGCATDANNANHSSHSHKKVSNKDMTCTRSCNDDRSKNTREHSGMRLWSREERPPYFAHSNHAVTAVPSSTAWRWRRQPRSLNEIGQNYEIARQMLLRWAAHSLCANGMMCSRGSYLYDLLTTQLERVQRELNPEWVYRDGHGSLLLELYVAVIASFLPPPDALPCTGRHERCHFLWQTPCTQYGTCYDKVPRDCTNDMVENTRAVYRAKENSLDEVDRFDATRLCHMEHEVCAFLTRWALLPDPHKYYLPGDDCLVPRAQQAAYLPPPVASSRQAVCPKAEKLKTTASNTSVAEAKAEEQADQRNRHANSGLFSPRETTPRALYVASVFPYLTNGVLLCLLARSEPVMKRLQSRQRLIELAHRSAESSKCNSKSNSGNHNDTLFSEMCSHQGGGAMTTLPASLASAAVHWNPRTRGTCMNNIHLALRYFRLLGNSLACRAARTDLPDRIFRGHRRSIVCLLAEVCAAVGSERNALPVSLLRTREASLPRTVTTSLIGEGAEAHTGRGGREDATTASSPFAVTVPTRAATATRARAEAAAAAPTSDMASPGQIRAATATRAGRGILACVPCDSGLPSPLEALERVCAQGVQISERETAALYNWLHSLLGTHFVYNAENANFTVQSSSFNLIVDATHAVREEWVHGRNGRTEKQRRDAEHAPPCPLHRPHEPCLIFSDGVILAYVIRTLERRRCDRLECVLPASKVAARRFNVRRCLMFLQTECGVTCTVPLMEEWLLRGDCRGVFGILQILRNAYKHYSLV